MTNSEEICRESESVSTALRPKCGAERVFKGVTSGKGFFVVGGDYRRMEGEEHEPAFEVGRVQREQDWEAGRVGCKDDSAYRPNPDRINA